MRCLPRRKKQLWIFVLLFACLICVYLSYNHLSDSKKQSHGRTSFPYNPQLERSHIQLREKAQAELKRAKSRIGNTGFLGQFDLNVDHPNVDANAAINGLRGLEADDDYVTPDEMIARLKLLLIDLNPTNWKTALDVDDMLLQVKSELFDLGMDSKLSCGDITTLKPGGFRYRSHYGKKYVERLAMNYYHSVVVKSPGKDTELKIACMQMDYNERRCNVMSNYNLMRELIYLLVLNSPSIVKLKGFCLRGETIDPRLPKKGVMIVTEAGEEVMLSALIQFPKLTKFQIAESLLKLLVYMDESPVGSLRLDKLHIQDFVLFGTSLKLVDLDNIHIGEIACVEDKDCKIPEMTRKVIKCQNNTCKGRNAMNNLLWFNRIILKHLLSSVSTKHPMEVSKALENAQNLEITTKELLKKVIIWKEEDSKMNEDPIIVRAKDRERNLISNNNNDVWNSNKLQSVIGNIKKKVDKDNQDIRDTIGNVDFRKRRQTTKPPKRYDDQPAKSYFNENEHRQLDEGNVEYSREDHANYPGLYDYFCNRSRVSWGCVLTIHSVDEAKIFCNSDARCQSFVLFSSNPEQTVIMTSVFKNSAKGKANYNKGAVLFSKKKARERNTIPGSIPDVQSQLETVKPSPQADIQTCSKKVLNQTALGRASREKRLLTHLGLKGLSEDDWKKFAKSVKIVRSQGLSPMSHKLVTGGRFKIVYETNALGLKKGEFLLEKGPTHHHISFLIAHYLDRILGLFHVPPAVSRVLSWNDIQEITGDKKFQELYAKYNQSDAIHGVITLPVPPVMKSDKVTISNQETIVTSIHPYTRTEKSQLEYILLWSLMKFTPPAHGFLGYKGHLIHFEADTGFGSMKKSMQGYFYNCQFPNTVFKTLLCYKCSTSQRLSKICGLGHEVMRQVKESGVSRLDLQIGQYTESYLDAIIDNNAAVLLTVMEHCIKTFTREKVLY